MYDELVDELMGRSASELDDHVRALELDRRRIDAELAAAVGEVDRRRMYLDDGHRSTKGYLRATCNWSHHEAGRVRRLGTAAAAVPGLGEALYTGRIGTPQADELAAAHANPRVRARLVEFAPLLLDQAERLRFDEFRACVRRFVVLADLEGAHRDLDESIAKRRVHLSTVNGSLHLDAAGGDPLVNAELDAIFRRFTEREFQADVAARRAEFGDRADEHPLPRTAAQRSYDAFVALMQHAVTNLDAGGSAKTSEPLVNILVDQHTWATLLANAGLAPDSTLAGEPVDPFTGVAEPDDLLDDLLADAGDCGDVGGPPDAGEPGHGDGPRCETSTGVVLHPHEVLRAALAGHIRRVVLGTPSVITNMGRKSRLFTGAAREAAKLLITHCDHPGCDLPADICQVDHAIEWSADGLTDQDNAGVRCGSHNRFKHRQRWRTRRDIHGTTYTIRPDGTIILPVGARPPTFPDHDDTADHADHADAVTERDLRAAS